MSLPVFDPTKHHIGLGPTGGEQSGFFIDGGYERSRQRYGTPSEFGGDRDQLAPSVLSRWTQDDFSGGGGQDLWGEDPAMFTRPKNLLPALIQRSARTIPPLTYFIGAGPVDANASLGVFATGGNQIAVVDDDRIRFYHAETGALIDDMNPGYTVQAAAHDPTDNKVYTVVENQTTSRKRLESRMANVAITVIAEFPAALDNFNATGLETTAGRDILVAFYGHLWLIDVNDARTSAEFTRIGRLPGSWRDSVTYNGLTYILVTDSELATQVVAWDGSAILPVASFPYNFLGKAITVYGGRIYVCGSGKDITDVDRYAQLYEITGSSLRLVKSYADEARSGLAAPATFYEMTVHNGLLFAGTDIGWLLAYDLTRDALWSEIEIRSDTGTRTLQARRLLSTREKLFTWCYDPNRTLPEDGFYRMATVDADLDGATYDCELETSDFAPEPARDKRLSELRLLTRAGSGVPTLPTMEYSLDGGDTWTAVASTSVVSGRFRDTTYDLTGLDTTTVVRFRFTMAKTTVSYEEFVAFTMTFLMLDSGKRAWRFTVNGGATLTQLDGETLEQDTGLIESTLEGWCDDKTLLDYADTDGETRKVQITDISTTSPLVFSRLDDGSREGYYSLLLTEV